MKRQVRRGVFETNSSSTHSLTMCSEEEYNQWKRGELMIDVYNDVLVKVRIEMTDKDKEEAEKYYNRSKTKYWKDWNQLTEEEIDEWYYNYMYQYKNVDRYRYRTYEEFCGDDYLEFFEERYTASNGEVIIAFGKFGYDG